MDERYYIAGGLALLLLALVVYLFDSVDRYRRAVRKARQGAATSDGEGEAKYITEGDRASMALSGGQDSGDAEASQGADEAHPNAAERIADLYHSLEGIDTPELSPAPVPAPPAEAAPAPLADPLAAYLESERVSAEAPVPEEPTHAHASRPIASGPGGDDFAELMSALEAMGPADAIAEPTPPEAAPEHSVPQQAVPPAPAHAPGGSLSDELERLMAAAESQSALLPPEVHERSAESTEAAEPEPSFQPPPLLPPLSVGQALSAPSVEIPPAMPATAPESAPAPASAASPAPVPTPAPVTVPVSPAAGTSAAESAPAAPAPAASEPEYSLVAPVELQFTGGGGRVGVKPGTRSYAEFQRLAGIMLGDLRAARGH